MKSVAARRTVLSLAVLSSLAIMAALWAFYLIPTTQAQPQVGPSAAPLAVGATLTVNTTNDEENADGDCSLREAITAANTNAQVDQCDASGSDATDTIVFAPSADEGTITLASVLTISSNVNIQGPGADQLRISGNNTVQVFSITSDANALNKTFQVRVRQREEDCTIGRSPNGHMLRCITVDLFDTDASALEDAQLFFNATLAVILTDAEIELLGGPDAAFAAWRSGELRFQRHNPGNLARPWTDVTTSLGDNGEISAPALSHFSTFALVYSPGVPALPPPPPNTKPGPILPDVGDASLGGNWSLLLTIGGALSLLAGGILLRRRGRWTKA
ncbi:MAG: hypothetical protein C1O27_001964 [Chloroflexi bacterium]|jgi:CSLREA domain-containing protein|nr:MAG: hypothetical protein C1O27_001964 [Chloroflexota bacterium]